MSYSRLNGKWGQVTSSCTAQCPDGQNTQAFRYVYDRFGNRWQQNVTAGAGPSPQFSFDANNRIAAGVAYDAAGELTSDGTHTYQYDGAGRLTGVDGGATASYVYDAEGRRVERAVGGQKFEEIYDLGGHMVAEMAAANGAWQRGEVFGAGRHIASYADGTTYFPHADWLGTERVRATAGDNPYEACASLWFGDGLACRFAGSSLDPSPLHFTGKQRDAETGLDYFGARYDSSSLGRFITPDPLGLMLVQSGAKGLLGHELNPQDWNMYSYVLNSPVTLTDPTGMNACNSKDKSTTECEVAIQIQNRHKNSKGQYDDQFTGVEGQKNYNATATVYVGSKGKDGKVSWHTAGTFLAKTTPSSGRYGTIRAGLYIGSRIMHRGRYPAILLSGPATGFGKVKALGGSDPFTKLSYISSAELHRSGFGNITGFTRAGTPISEGCSVVACSMYSSFGQATGLSAPAPQMSFEVFLEAAANMEHP